MRDQRGGAHTHTHARARGERHFRISSAVEECANAPFSLETQASDSHGASVARARGMHDEFGKHTVLWRRHSVYDDGRCSLRHCGWVSRCTLFALAT